eukprot:Nitzschia sp. Nitz4//scaffold6_size259037//173770//174444//NITZ4_001094-RA/size259037-processed-gene-0.83-mRNA-1//-1//CDS//3329556953//4119//frame0
MISTFSLSRCGIMLILLLGLACNQAAYIVSIPPHDEECYFVAPPRKTGTLFGNYEMLDDELSPKAFTVMVYDPAKKNRVLHRSVTGKREGSFKIKLLEGQKVNVCLQNGLRTTGRGKKAETKGHDGEPRTAGLKVSFEEQNELEELHNQNSKVSDAAVGLAKELEKLQDHHQYMKTREAIHRETVEGTFSRLMSWTLLEGFTVVTVAVGQILYFRRFLERRRYV